ncbi:cryptochrome/photolyase family protein [Aestuariibacter sp. A3R04]|uniref:cryptochrome/photolyase family protein n=1 Tax=Aestuariibacter sp. A3R04 TaxID=2841571 RepID=UPI001C08C42E|nr:cryptochrome/photolyase family protein [Aestuariibacter sp. A3R04]MBU3022049.1 cryptochrome/photolyase family protein [Aestuariibacter sp. A3R04]
MSSAVLIYPHQLFSAHPAFGEPLPVYLIEESLLLTFNPIHRAKLVLHKLSMDAYQSRLEKAGMHVTRLSVKNYPTTSSVFDKLKGDGIRNIHVADTTDNYLEKALAGSGLNRIWYDSPCFILKKATAIARFNDSNRFMANFYKGLRRELNILMDDRQPRGGKWSFDEDNRRKIPKSETLPVDVAKFENKAVADAVKWAEQVDAEKYGEACCWLPYTHSGATAYLEQFLEQRFEKFGPYEDAMTTRGVRLWHSAISPLMNIGLLTPKQVLGRALDFAEEYNIALNSLEGFVRQILGWREFIRASYEVDGGEMRNTNHWLHRRTLPKSFWLAETGLPPVDHAISTALTWGYNHHIDRLMVLGNVMLLSETQPHDVYKWFMGMYLDAYDWVMVPNVYGMSQFADGGSFATKPYISGANYIRKMSDYPSGNWEKTWTGLYWHFINKHSALFNGNQRLSMMPRVLEKMTPETRNGHFSAAKAFLAGVEDG